MFEDCIEEERVEELKEARIEERMFNCFVEGSWLGLLVGFFLILSSCGGGLRFFREGCRLGLWFSRFFEFDFLDREFRGRDGKRGFFESCRWGDRGRGGGCGLRFWVLWGRGNVFNYS